MAFVTEQLALLGLNEREVKVFVALTTFGRMGITKIAGRSGVTRTTVDYIIRSLLKQGLVVREKVGGHWEYTITLEDVAGKLDSLENKLRKNYIPTINDKKTVTNAAEHVLSQIEQSFSTHSNERVMVSVGLSPKQKTDKLFIEQYLTHSRLSSAKLEIITSREVAELFENKVPQLVPMMCVNEVRLNLLPQLLCIQGLDVVAFHDEVLIVDHFRMQIERVIAVLGVEAINNLLRIAVETAWNIDFATYLQNRVEYNRKS